MNLELQKPQATRRCDYNHPLSLATVPATARFSPASVFSTKLKKTFASIFCHTAFKKKKSHLALDVYMISPIKLSSATLDECRIIKNHCHNI